MLEIKNLTYKYENHIALNNINLKIEKGEKIAILGNNGSGKTTFFLCCNGVYKTKNAVSFNGDYEPKTLRRNVGLVFQDADTQIIGNTVEKEISFDAIFAFTDTLAIGAMNRLRDLGKKIPEEIAIASFSGTVLSTIVYPQLTTVEPPLQQMGKGVAELIIEKIKEPLSPNRSIVLDAEIKLRASSKKEKK